MISQHWPVNEMNSSQKCMVYLQCFILINFRMSSCIICPQLKCWTYFTLRLLPSNLCVCPRSSREESFNTLPKVTNYVNTLLLLLFQYSWIHSELLAVLLLLKWCHITFRDVKKLTWVLQIRIAFRLHQIIVGHLKFNIVILR